MNAPKASDSPTGRPKSSEQEDDEESGGDEAADRRAAPGGRVVEARRAGLAAAASLRPVAGLLARAGTPATAAASMRPPWVPRCLRRRRFFVWAMA